MKMIDDAMLAAVVTDLTPEAMALEFSEWDNAKQADFLNEVGRLFGAWPVSAADRQCMTIVWGDGREAGLTDTGAGWIEQMCGWVSDVEG